MEDLQLASDLVVSGMTAANAGGGMYCCRYYYYYYYFMTKEI